MTIRAEGDGRYRCSYLLKSDNDMEDSVEAKRLVLLALHSVWWTVFCGLVPEALPEYERAGQRVEELCQSLRGATSAWLAEAG